MRNKISELEGNKENGTRMEEDISDLRYKMQVIQYEN